MEEQRFRNNSLRRMILQSVGHAPASAMYGERTVSPEHIENFLSLPVDTRYQVPLRNPDGTRRFPVGYLPPDDTVPAG